MTTPDAFEQHLATAMRAYLDEAPAEIDAGALVRRFAVAHPRRQSLVPVQLTSRPLAWLALAALLIVATAAAAVLGGLPQVPAPTPTPTPDTRRALLAFARGADVFLADEQSGRLIRPDGTNGLYLGAWSPDGRWLSMGTEREVLLLDATTMQLVPAPLPDTGPGSATASPVPTLPAGPTAAPIPTPIGGFGYGYVGWLHYGQSILLHEYGTLNRIFAVDIATGGTVELPTLGLCWPVLSADARFIAAIDGKKVVVVAVASGARVEVANFGGLGCGYDFGFDAPSWSADGSRLAVVTATSIRVVNRDGSAGSDIVNLDFLPTDPPARSVRPLWAPGGKWIAFRGPQGLEITRPDGSGRRLLAAGDIDESRYAWTPDSARIEYGFAVADGISLWSVDVETGETHAIEIAQPYVDAFARQPITADTPLVTLP